MELLGELPTSSAAGHAQVGPLAAGAGSRGGLASKLHNRKSPWLQTCSGRTYNIGSQYL